MTDTPLRDWRSIQDEVLRRIHDREWRPGDLIPSEADLAREFGCARTTVNRALRNVAEIGLLDRRRKAGTRVTVEPETRVRLSIPLIRAEVEGRGLTYGYRLLTRQLRKPPPDVARAMTLKGAQPALRLVSLHLGAGAPYALEARWINLAAAPGADSESFEDRSGNEWLLANTPYTHGEITFSAIPADAETAAALRCAEGAAVFVTDRATWLHEVAITRVRLSFAPGYQLRTAL